MRHFLNGAKKVNAAFVWRRLLHFPYEIFLGDGHLRGSCGEILTRLNRTLVETMRGDSAGHVSPYVLRNGQVEQLPVCSLPLGISGDEEYDELVTPIQYGDRMVLYTDGVVETLNERGEIAGFAQFESDLAKLDEQAPLCEQLNVMLQTVKPSAGWRHEDDRTIVIVGWV